MPLDRGVRMLRRIMDLRDVEDGRHAAVELAQRSEQLADVDVLWPVDGRELEENVLIIVDLAVRRAVLDEDAVGEKTAQRGLELVMMRIDEAGHHDAPGRVDHLRVASVDVGTDGGDLLTVDEYVGLRVVADLRVDRHDRAAADQVSPAGFAAPRGHLAGLRGSRTWGEQVDPGLNGAGRGRAFQELAAAEGLQSDRIAQDAHGIPPRFCRIFSALGLGAAAENLGGRASAIPTRHPGQIFRYAKFTSRHEYISLRSTFKVKPEGGSVSV